MILKLSLTFLALFVLGSSLHAEENKSKLMKIITKYETLSKSFNCKSITTQSLKKTLSKNEDIILVDIREAKEQKVSMLKNAITESEFIKNFEKYKKKKIVVYCTIGFRSGKFAEKHKKLDIYNLEGGILAWSHFQGKFYQNNVETNKVHIYSKDWNFLNSHYKAIFE